MEWSIALGQRCSYSAHLTKYLEILSGYTTLKRKNPSAAAARVPCGQWVSSGSLSPCSSELHFREQVFNEYLWPAYSK